jgi:hypothetical protein
MSALKPNICKAMTENVWQRLKQAGVVTVTDFISRDREQLAQSCGIAYKVIVIKKQNKTCALLIRQGQFYFRFQFSIHSYVKTSSIVHVTAIGYSSGLCLLERFLISHALLDHPIQWMLLLIEFQDVVSISRVLLAEYSSMPVSTYDLYTNIVTSQSIISSGISR